VVHNRWELAGEQGIQRADDCGTQPASTADSVLCALLYQLLLLLLLMLMLLGREERSCQH
jgi:hypothetical protein